MKERRQQGMNGQRLFCLLLFTSVLMLSGRMQGQQPSSLTLVGHIPLPDVSGRIDHMAVDVRGHRLFIAAVENHSVEVVDLRSAKRVYTITGLREPQGVFYDPSSDRLFVACSLDGTVRVFDGTTFRPITKIKLTEDADNIRYDALRRQIIVGYAGAKKLRHRNEGTGGLAFITTGGKLAGEIIIDAHPESFQVDQTGTRLFVNVPERKEIEVVDLGSRKVVARWPVTSASNNFPMALDEQNHRLLVGGWTPPRLIAFDTINGKEVGETDIQGKSDDLFYDAQRRRVYVLTSVGVLQVFEQIDPDRYNRIAQYPTRQGAQTGLFVPEWGKLFAAERREGAQQADLLVYQAQ